MLAGLPGAGSRPRRRWWATPSTGPGSGRPTPRPTSATPPWSSAAAWAPRPRGEPGVAAFLGGGWPTRSRARGRWGTSAWPAASDSYPALDGRGTPLGVDARACLALGETRSSTPGSCTGSAAARSAPASPGSRWRPSAGAPGRAPPRTWPAETRSSSSSGRGRRGGGGGDRRPGAGLGGGLGVAAHRTRRPVHVTGERGPRGPLTAVVARVPVVRPGERLAPGPVGRARLAHPRAAPAPAAPGLVGEACAAVSGAALERPLGPRARPGAARGRPVRGWPDAGRA